MSETRSAIEPTDSAATSNPGRIRALAHPVRLALLEFLGDAGTATATDCARHTGQTVANCSFHLRTLAKYGFIEPADRQGRERPWRKSPDRQTMFSPDPHDGDSVRAVVELGVLSVELESARLVALLRSSHDRWRETGEHDGSVTITKDSFWATPEEAADVVAILTHLSESFESRENDPAQRPDGARLMRLFATVTADPETPAASAARHSARGES